ncbi:MAG TPA: hypothetical protein VMU07_00690 [Candidatus Paceibacterota bacterium]|nr:hypothetical protein [Candidatus Paceibacterota bacterium]
MNNKTIAFAVIAIVAAAGIYLGTHNASAQVNLYHEGSMLASLSSSTVSAGTSVVVSGSVNSNWTEEATQCAHNQNAYTTVDWDTIDSVGYTVVNSLGQQVANGSIIPTLTKGGKLGNCGPPFQAGFSNDYSFSFSIPTGGFTGGVYTVNLTSVDRGTTVFKGNPGTSATFTVTGGGFGPKLTASLTPQSATSTLTVTGDVLGGSKNSTCDVKCTCRTPQSVNTVSWSVTNTSLSGSMPTTISTLGSMGETCPGGVPVTIDYGGDNDYSINSNLNVSSLSPGSYTLVLTASNGIGVSTVSLPFTIIAPAITVTVSPSTASVQTGKTQQFTATVTGSANTAVTWSVVGGSGNGTISSNGLYTAPATVPSPATVTIKATSQADASKSGSATVTVTAAPPPPGQITVNSVNSETGEQVSATWDVTGPTGDLCSNHYCSGYSQTYKNVTLGNYIVAPGTATGYTVNDLNKNPIALHSSLIDAIFALSKELIPQAQAAVVLPVPSQTITAALPSATFNINWNPVASMLISPGSLTFNAAGPQTISVSNNGTKGSGLTWSETVTYKSGSNWLIVSPSSDAKQLGTTSTADTVTVNVSSTGLALGTYTATATFSGTSWAGNTKDGSPTRTLSVSFTKSSLNCPADGQALCGVPPSCPIFSATPQSIVVPSNSTLTYSCQSVSSCSISGGEFNGKSLSVDGSNNADGSISASPTQNTTYNLLCYGVKNNKNVTATNSVQVTIQNPSTGECGPDQPGCQGQ